MAAAQRIKVAMIVSDEREVRSLPDAPEPSFGPAPDALLMGLATLEDCEVHTICCVQRPVRVPEFVFGRFRHHSLLVPKIGWLRSGYLGCSRAIRRALRAIDPDVVHGQGTERYCAISAARSGFPNVITIHGHMRRVAQINGARPFSFYWLTARLESYVVPRAGGVVCISRYAQKAVAGAARRTWVIPNALRPGFFNKVSQPQTPPVILCLGTISEVKNQNWLIGSLDPVARQHSFRLRFLGETAEQSIYGREFQELVAARPWCEYLGWKDQTGVQQQLEVAAGLVLPSVEENLGLVVLEAMAMGVPVLGAAVGGIVDSIEDGRTGWLFAPNDSESLRSKLGILLEDPAQARALAARGREKAAGYRPEVIGRRHLEIYRELAKKRG